VYSALVSRQRPRNARQPAADRLHPLLARIQARHPELSPLQRRIVDFFLNHPDEAVFFTTTAFARELHVSEASVVRLCRALGFEGFRDFRVAFQDYVREPLSRVSRIRMMGARARGSLSQLIDEVMNNDIRNLQATCRALDHGLVLDVADRLWRARRVYVLGMRSAHSVAVFLHFALRLLGRDSRLMTPGIGDLPEQLVEVDGRDVALGISFERYAKVSIELFEACLARGATGIALTDKPTSPLARKAAVVLMSQTHYLTFIDSYVAPFSLANAILTVLAVRQRAAATKSLARMEEVWRVMHTYQ
jgi:DNA-binding MurR/RpiR family transcriptional regulator